MMRITVNKNAEGLVNYFSQSLSQEDYFFGNQKVMGYWGGKLRTELGLPREVSRKAFSRLARKLHPITGKSLSLRKDTVSRSSIEYMFSAPKSVSLVMALSDEKTAKDILNIHRFSVRKALSEIENDMQTQTRIEGRKVYVTTGNILVARFDHMLSRPTDDPSINDKTVLPDMLLHSHAVVMSLTKFNGRFQAIEASTIHRTAQYYENLYHSYLAKGLQDLGFDIRRTKHRYEIHSLGLTKRTLDKFSRRKNEIINAVKKQGVTSKKAIDKLRVLTRKSKTEITKGINLKQAWWSRLTPIEKAAVKNAKGEVKPSINKIDAKRAIDLSLHHHLEKRSTVPTKILLAEAMKLGYGTLNIKALRQELKSRENMIYGSRGYVEYTTTKQRVIEEDRMIEFASQTKGQMKAVHSNYKVKQDFLTHEQKAAVQKILTSNHQVDVLMGKAGTGKTTTLKEIHQAHKEVGKKIFAFAQSATASRQVLVENGFKSANTIASFLQNKNAQNKIKDQTILIDEAGLLGVQDMSKIFEIAKKQNSRVLLVGDTSQHNSPVYGDALRLLIKKSELDPAHISKIQRQKPNPAYKSAVKDLAEGRITSGFKKLDDMGAIKEIENIDDRHREIAKAYLKAIDQKRKAIIISPTHKEINLLNHVIRNKLREHGKLKGTDQLVTIQKPFHLTEAQKQDVKNYENGQTIQFVKHAKGFKAGERYNVVKCENDHIQIAKLGLRSPLVKLPKEHADRYQVYDVEKIKLTTGDKIRITQNAKVNGKRISNGQEYTIQGFNKDGSIKLSGEKTLDRNFGHLNYAYVSTSFSAQGKTSDVVIIANSMLSAGATNMKQFYTSASRAKHGISIFTDCKEDLLQSITKSGDRLSARELAGNRYRIPIQKNRQVQRLNYYNRLIQKIKTYGRTKKTYQRNIQRSFDK